MAMYGRHGEAPLPIVAAYSPSHCFYAAIEAARIALKYRTPVILLSDGYLANGSEPWRLPDVESLPDISVPFATEPNHVDATAPEFWPYLRDPETLARPWAIPGTPGLEHRIGGIEKEDGTGNITYDPDNHEQMVAPAGRQDRRHRRRHPAGRGRRRRDDAELLVLGLGLHVGRHRRRRATGSAAAGAQGRAGPPRAPQPVPAEPRRGRCAATRKVLVPEMNLGQLSRLVRAEYLVDARSVTKVQGLPFTAGRDRRRHRWSCSDDRHRLVPVTTKKDWTSDQEVRWCPGCGDYSILTAVQLLMPELGVRRENTVFVSGIGCCGPLPVLHEHLRDAHDPRAGAGHRHRPGHGPARPRRVGGHRRRRRPVDRRQPPHPRAAPQRQPHDPAVQQPDLRAHQGPVLADERGRARSPSRRRSARSTTRSTRISLALGAEATFVARTHDMDRKHMMEMFRRGPRPPGRGVRRDLPELQRLQRRRVRGDHGQGGAATTC